MWYARGGGKKNSYIKKKKNLGMNQLERNNFELKMYNSIRINHPLSFPVATHVHLLYARVFWLHFLSCIVANIKVLFFFIYLRYEGGSQLFIFLLKPI